MAKKRKYLNVEQSKLINLDQFKSVHFLERKKLNKDALIVQCGYFLYDFSNNPSLFSTI